MLASLLLTSTPTSAQQPLLTLEVDSVIMNWQDEFVLRLSIYGPDEMVLPPVTIDGLDQFQLQGTGKNLLQIPRGKTKRWILTYTLVAAETGNFKVGPAIVTHEGQTYRSNIVFLTIEGPAAARQREKAVREQEKKQAVEPPQKKEQKPPPAAEPLKKEEKKPAAESAKKEEKKAPVEPLKEQKKSTAEPVKKEEKKAPAEPPKEEQKPPVEEPKPQQQQQLVKPPVVMSSAQIGDKILILMETRKYKPYQLQGFPVTVRLLSQLPVENLNFLEEADFPGFLRYDFPFTSKPKGEVVSYKNKTYASYELVKFLLFPLEVGTIEIPPVRCELRVRVPSGAFPAADLKLDLERSSNKLNLRVTPSPEGAAVGDFVLKNEIVVDEPESKVLRMILEGKGQLSTFNFPEVQGERFVARKLGASIAAKIEGENLISRKTQEIEITPEKATTSVVLPELRIREFDPETGVLGLLKLPPVRFQFSPPGTAPKQKLAFPALSGGAFWILFLVLSLLTAFVHFRNYKLPARRTPLRLHKLFSNKNLKLHISKSAARNLYQQISTEIARQEQNSAALNDAITRHLPQHEWLNIQRGLRKLEHTAYSPVKPAPVTYDEIKRLCEKIEALWVQ